MGKQLWCGGSGRRGSSSGAEVVDDGGNSSGAAVVADGKADPVRRQWNLRRGSLRLSGMRKGGRWRRGLIEGQFI